MRIKPGNDSNLNYNKIRIKATSAEENIDKNGSSTYSNIQLTFRQKLYNVTSTDNTIFISSHNNMKKST